MSLKKRLKKANEGNLFLEDYETSEKKRVAKLDKKGLRKEVERLNKRIDWMREEESEEGLYRLDLEQAIEKLLTKIVYTSEFGTHCLYCTATSREYVKMLIHDDDCAITNAIRVLMRQEKTKSEQENTP